MGSITERVDGPRPLPAHEFREMHVTDMNRILSDYITHYRPMMKGHVSDIYSVGMQKRFARLARKNKLLVAVDPTPEAFAAKRDVLGWICFRAWDDKALVVHYIYVRHTLRGQGLGQALLKAAGWREGLPIISSHKYRLPRQLRREFKVIINEFLLEEIAEWD